MEQQEKLKLLRGLYFLSQDEMAQLAGCQRSYYAAAESKNRLPLLQKQTKRLERHLGFEATWFAGMADHQPLVRNRLLLINMDWTARLLGVTANVRSSRINIAEKAVRTYLPKLLGDTGVVACLRGVAPGGGRVVLFVLNAEDPQGLVLSTMAEQRIADIVAEVAAPHAVPADPLTLSDSEHADIAAGSAPALHNFLKGCNLAKDVSTIFGSALHSMGERLFDYEELFGDNARKIALRRIVQDMEMHRISVAEVAEAAEAIGQHSG
jgi:DNA-binding XRE family transcriptional regulator